MFVLIVIGICAVIAVVCAIGCLILLILTVCGNLPANPKKSNTADYVITLTVQSPVGYIHDQTVSTDGGESGKVEETVTTEGPAYIKV